MKKASLIKKIASLIIFVAFYFLSIATSNFPYPEYAENPTLSFITSLLALLSFLLVTVAFCKSKKYLIALSVFWLLVVGSALLNIFKHDYTSFVIIDLIIDLPLIIYALPLIHFDRAVGNLCEILNINQINDYVVLIHISIVVALFYLTYFISRKIANRKTKKQMQ